MYHMESLYFTEYFWFPCEKFKKYAAKLRTNERSVLQMIRCYEIDPHLTDMTRLLIGSQSKEMKKGIQHFCSKMEIESACRKTSFLPKEIAKMTEPLELYAYLAKRDDKEKENEKAFQTLALACYDPTLFISETRLFGSYPAQNNVPSKYTKRKKTCQRFYRDLDAYYHELALYCDYVNRGTKGLNRDCTQSQSLSQDEIGHMSNDINALYKEYYYSVQGATNSAKKFPKVNRRLLEHSCTNPWLLPLAHIILTRDAQYQMTGRVKYKASMLLTAESDSVLASEQSIAKANRLAQHTRNFCIEIRNVFGRYLSSKHVTSPVLTLDHKAWDEVREHANTTRLNTLPTQIAWQQQSSTLMTHDQHSPAPFTAPDCDMRMFSILLGMAYDLSISHVEDMIKVLPTYILERQTPDSIVKVIGLDHVVIEANKKPSLAEVIGAAKKMAQPSTYYNEVSADKIIHNLRADYELLAKAQVVPAISQDNPFSCKSFYRNISSFIHFRDMTTIGLWLSHSVDSWALPSIELPSLLSECMEHLDKSLKQYCKFTKILEIMGVTIDSSDQQRLLKTDQTMCNVRYQISNAMNWERAQEFITNNLLKKDCNHTNERKSFQYDTMRRYWKTLMPEYTANDNSLWFYATFSQTTIESINWMKARIQNLLLEYSRDFMKEIKKS